MSSVKGAQAISRTMQVLRAIAGKQGFGATLSYITLRTGLTKPTAHRILQALVAEGMVEKSDNEGYLLGPECYMLGVIADQRYGLSQIASGTVARIAAKCGDSAFFSIRSEWHTLCLIREDGDYPIKTHVLQPGTRLPLGVGGGGIAMLAALDDNEIEKSLAANAEERAKHFPGDERADQLARVAECRTLGYGINRGSVVADSWGIGAVVRDDKKCVLGALTIAAIASRLQPDRQQELGPLLMQEAAALEEKICEAQRMRR
ncbi:IclR family transcriptional regulator [Vreelandella arcis]|uniref:Transcriptional regulator, IclR family n=1 Tax=Vreelandella arcis TaxID=416873 RepID=A0A1H0GYZ5_9GAMM|nr:IclR family transcriptional regulator [Halomonas arcis]SDO12246.1 transcriptional regulator, IclR family [Halomonas arcis]